MEIIGNVHISGVLPGYNNYYFIPQEKENTHEICMEAGAGAATKFFGTKNTKLFSKGFYSSSVIDDFLEVNVGSSTSAHYKNIDIVRVINSKTSGYNVANLDIGESWGDSIFTANSTCIWKVKNPKILSSLMVFCDSIVTSTQEEFDAIRTDTFYLRSAKISGVLPSLVSNKINNISAVKDVVPEDVFERLDNLKTRVMYFNEYLKPSYTAILPTSVLANSSITYLTKYPESISINPKELFLDNGF